MTDAFAFKEALDALAGIKSSLFEIAGAGSADPRGHIEFLGICIKEGLDGVADAIRDLAAAIREEEP